MTAQNFEYRVEGMTCGHCEKSVIEEVSEIVGVSNVQASFANKTLTFTADAAINDEQVDAAVKEAGYELVS